MVAEKVDVISKKANSEKAFRWHSNGKTGFSLDNAERSEAGTDIILHLKKDAKEFSYAHQSIIIISRYRTRNI